ncbi:hypothetical protein [Speluncibacter jeojiensis]
MNVQTKRVEFATRDQDEATAFIEQTCAHHRPHFAVPRRPTEFAVSSTACGGIRVDRMRNSFEFGTTLDPHENLTFFQVCGGRMTLLDVDTEVLSPLLADELGNTLAAVALSVFPNTTTTVEQPPSPGCAGPPVVRHAVDHIDDQAGEPITVVDIAEVSGVGARASIRRTAARWGFARADRFAAAYRQAYGALPDAGRRDGPQRRVR